MAGLKLNKKKMREQRSRFVEEYFVDYNQTAAAIRAGYSPRSAKSIACELMKDPEIQDAIELRRSILSARIGVSVERIEAELAAMAFANVKHHYKKNERGEIVLKNINELSDLEAAAIQEVIVTKDKHGNTITRYKIADKKGPLELLGKKHKMFVDRLEVDNINRADSMKAARERVRNAATTDNE